MPYQQHDLVRLGEAGLLVLFAFTFSAELVATQVTGMERMNLSEIS